MGLLDLDLTICPLDVVLSVLYIVEFNKHMLHSMRTVHSLAPVSFHGLFILTTFSLLCAIVSSREGFFPVKEDKNYNFEIAYISQIVFLIFKVTL